MYAQCTRRWFLQEGALCITEQGKAFSWGAGNGAAALPTALPVLLQVVVVRLWWRFASSGAPPLNRGQVPGKGMGGGMPGKGPGQGIRGRQQVQHTNGNTHTGIVVREQLCRCLRCV